jgi:hypothetical protein
MKDIRDVTSTTFGLIIAYLLPGLTAFYSLSFFSVRIRNWFDHIFAGDASGGLILFMIFGAIVIGLQLSAVRWLIFEEIICRDCRFDATALSAISDAGRFAAYRLFMDEQLRYHQFWGAMSVAQPVLFYGWIMTQQGHTVLTWLSILLATLCEGMTIVAAITSLKRYTALRKILPSRLHDAERSTS